MDVVILCGGKGMRMREYSEKIPKALIDIGGRPMIWHIMKTYYHYGYDNFILCLGYKGELIKQYFSNMLLLNRNFKIEIDPDGYKIKYLDNVKEKWSITLIDTGEDVKTATRLKKVKDYIKGQEFFMTYGDGLSDININKLLEYHKEKGTYVTLTGINPASSYGELKINNGIVESFQEKPVTDSIINGGYMVINKEALNYIPNEDCMFEEEPLKNLVKAKQVSVFEHSGFWKAIDTAKDIESINSMYSNNDRKWMVWE